MKDLIQTAIDAGMFKTLTAKLTAAALLSQLEGTGPFTIFAPSDDAFAKLPAGAMENISKPENRERLISILKYHIVEGKLPAASISASKELHSIMGQPLEVSMVNGKVHVGNAVITKADIMATNGVIHVIDAVLMPKVAATASKR